ALAALAHARGELPLRPEPGFLGDTRFLPRVLGGAARVLRRRRRADLRAVEPHLLRAERDFPVEGGDARRQLLLLALPPLRRARGKRARPDLAPPRRAPAAGLRDEERLRQREPPRDAEALERRAKAPLELAKRLVLALDALRLGRAHRGLRLRGAAQVLD